MARGGKFGPRCAGARRRAALPSAMKHNAAVDGLPADWAADRRFQPRQRGHPRPRIGGPALDAVGRGAHIELTGLPHRIRGRRAGHQCAGDAVADAAGPPRAPGGGGEGGAHRDGAARGVVVDWPPAPHAHGSMLVTGVSEPSARGTPADANSASGLSARLCRSRAGGRTFRCRRPTTRRNWAACWPRRPTGQLGCLSSDTISRCSSR